MHVQRLHFLQQCSQTYFQTVIIFFVLRGVGCLVGGGRLGDIGNDELEDSLSPV